MPTPDPAQEPQPQQQPYDPQPYEQQPYQPQPPGVPYPPAYPPQYGYPYQAPRPTNGMAIAAMIVGIVGLCTPIAILGLIFGLIAKRQIKERNESGDGMATAGVVLGWIGVASVVFWVIYLVVVIGLFTTAVNEIDNLPSDGTTSWEWDTLLSLFARA